MAVSVCVFCDADEAVAADWYPMVAVDGCAVVRFHGLEIHAASVAHLDALARVVNEARTWLASGEGHCATGRG